MISLINTLAAAIDSVCNWLVDGRQKPWVREPGKAYLADAISPDMFDAYADLTWFGFQTERPMTETKTYDIPRYDALIERTFEKIKELSVVKGGEYAGDVDRLANFRRNAAAAGVTMEQCWQIYAGKHWDAIGQYIKDDAAGKERKRAEPLAGRVDDLIVYLLLFKAMLDERSVLGGEQASRPRPDGVLWLGNPPRVGDKIKTKSRIGWVRAVHGDAAYIHFLGASADECWRIRRSPEESDLTLVSRPTP